MINAPFYDGVSAKAHASTVNVSGNFLSVTYLENGFRKEHSFRMSELSQQNDGDKIILSKDLMMVILTREDWKSLRIKTSAGPNKNLVLTGAILFTLFTLLIIWHKQVIIAATELVPDFILDNAGRDIQKELEKKNCLSHEQERIVESAFLRIGKNKDAYTFFLIHDDVKNAFAMPGKVIVFHDAIFTELDSFETFTGILAHEISHLEKEHIKRGIVKSMLVNWVVFAVTNGSSGGNLVKGLVGARFNQAEEQEADEEAAKLLKEARINPAGVRNYFEGKMKKTDSLDRYLMLSHPEYADRIKTFRAQPVKYEPMNAKDWDILKKGCQSNL